MAAAAVSVSQKGKQDVATVFVNGVKRLSHIVFSTFEDLMACVCVCGVERQQFAVDAKAPLSVFMDYLRGPDPLAKRDSLWLLWKLSQDDSNKSRIRESGALDPLIDALESESTEIRRNALRTLCNLSFDGLR
jgi:hypothetical protein